MRREDVWTWTQIVLLSAFIVCFIAFVRIWAES